MTQTATLATYLLTCATVLLLTARYVVKNDPTLREAEADPAGPPSLGNPDD